MNANQPKPHFDPYANTYNPRWRSHPNFLWRTNNQAPIQNTMSNSMCNNDQHRKSTLEETMNTFIEFTMDNHKRHDQRLDSLEASIKRVEVQVGQIVDQLQGNQKGKLPSQPKKAMAVTIHQESRESKENDNGVEESPADNITLHSKIKGDDTEEKEEILAATPSDTYQERESLSLPSLYKVANPYR